MTVVPSALHAAPPVAVIGFELVRLPDGAQAGIWYPASGVPVLQSLGPWRQKAVPDAAPVGNRLPLIVMSHGTGGSFAGHLDTAAALAQNGFVVAAIEHPGDNWQDRSLSTAVEQRPAALQGLIGFMLGQWRFRRQLDPSRIGAFGFSAGGFTVLAAAGGRPDFSLMLPHCAAHPQFFDCQLLKAHPRGAAIWPDIHETRIKALVVAAPALGFTFTQAGLRSLTIPVQLWQAANDRTLPPPYYADAVRAALPRPPEFHEVPGAWHLDFLAPCAAGMPQMPICASAPGFDRARFHQTFNAEVVRFFQQHL